MANFYWYLNNQKWITDLSPSFNDPGRESGSHHASPVLIRADRKYSEIAFQLYLWDGIELVESDM